MLIVKNLRFRQKSSKSLPLVSVTSLVLMRLSLGGNFRFDFQPGIVAPSSGRTCFRGPPTLRGLLGSGAVIALIVKLIILSLVKWGKSRHNLRIQVRKVEAEMISVSSSLKDSRESEKLNNNRF